MTSKKGQLRSSSLRTGRQNNKEKWASLRRLYDAIQHAYIHQVTVLGGGVRNKVYEEYLKKSWLKKSGDVKLYSPETQGTLITIGEKSMPECIITKMERQIWWQRSDSSLKGIPVVADHWKEIRSSRRKTHTYWKKNTLNQDVCNNIMFKKWREVKIHKKLELICYSWTNPIRNSLNETFRCKLKHTTQQIDSIWRNTEVITEDGKWENYTRQY